jgi:hypothetical protein
MSDLHASLAALLQTLPSEPPFSFSQPALEELKQTVLAMPLPESARLVEEAWAIVQALDSQGHTAAGNQVSNFILDTVPTLSARVDAELKDLEAQARGEIERAFSAYRPIVGAEPDPETPVVSATELLRSRGVKG